MKIDDVPVSGLEFLDLSLPHAVPEPQEFHRRPFIGILHDPGAPVPGNLDGLSFILRQAQTGMQPVGWPGDGAGYRSGAGECSSSTPGDMRVVDVEDLDSELEVLQTAHSRNPTAISVLHHVLVAGENVPVDTAFTIESLAYSTLMAGPEFAQWLAEHRAVSGVSVAGSVPSPGGHACEDECEHDHVFLDREGDTLLVTLDRPERKNAFGRVMRVELLQALEILDSDPSLRVRLTGNGSVFCSGGDLQEFGHSSDVSLAHLIRSEHHVGRVVHRHRARTDVYAHGACIGAGIEIPALASSFRVQPGTWFQLPEVGMGLIPGAGGTVSVPRRIGRWRAAYMAITGTRIETTTALQWGLVDGIGDA